MIRKLLARRRYRADVRAAMGWVLFGMREPMFTAFMRAYPNLQSAIDGAFAEGKSTDALSVELAALTFADFLLNLKSERRARVLDEIRNPPKDVTSEQDPITRIVLIALGNVDMMAVGKRIEQSQNETFASEVIGALQGLAFEQRSAGRLIRSLEDLTGLPRQGS